MAEKKHTYDLGIHFTRTEAQVLIKLIDKEDIPQSKKQCLVNVKKKLELTIQNYCSRQPNARRYKN